MAQYNLPRKDNQLRAPARPPAVPVMVPSPPPPMDPATQKALLATIARGEATGYNSLAGNGTFSDFSRHPTPGPSQPAGRYQFLGSTWNEQAKKYGYKDFSPGTQDTAAVNYAREVYKRKTGGNLDEALASGDPAAINAVGQALNETWTSLPGGSEQNQPWKGRQFADVYNENLKGGRDGAAGYGGIGSDSAGSARAADAAAANTDTASTTTPDDTTKDDKKKKKNYGEAAGEGLEALGKLYAEGPVAKNAARASGPANIAPPSLPMAMGPIPMVDAKRAEAQRQQLAYAMQRLNSGRLS